uniref:Dynein light intermediate chain n=1 Tax=Mesocestoides corti TaxID=53468 RepID=A0A5K3EJ83_MESCO
MSTIPRAYILSAHADGIANMVFTELTSSGGSGGEGCMLIDCKYYTASVRLELITNADSKPPLKEAEAFIICFDAGEPKSWDAVCDWLKLVKDGGDIPVQLLVCDRLPEDDFRTRIVSEATRNHCEVVQISPLPDDIEEGDEYGTARLKSALAAHHWPGLKLKSSNKVVDKPENLIKPTTPTKPKSSNSINRGENKDADAFGELFPKLLEMRSKATSMHHDERRKVAEQNHDVCILSFLLPDSLQFSEVLKREFGALSKSGGTTISNYRPSRWALTPAAASAMTIQFWKALNLDEDELAGLSSSESD